MKGNRHREISILLSVLFLVVSLGFKGSGGIRIEKAHVRTAAKGMTTAAYFKIVNRSEKPDTLYDVEASFAGMSQLHETYSENGMTGMREIEHIVIPPKSEFDFKPGGYHVMLMNVKKALKIGTKVELKLFFKSAGVVNVKAAVGK